jgi:predicted DNA-binding protein YlxM (UPF0122 family)
MECYGSYDKNHKFNPEKCASCELAEWCKDAGDISLSHQISYDKANYGISSTGRPDDPADPEHKEKERDAMWMALFRLVLEIDDYRIRTIIRLKIQDPDISLAQIAKRFGVTKQAIGKDIQRVVDQFPELGVILCNRPMYNRWRKTRLTGENPIFRRKRKNSKAIQLQFRFPKASHPDLLLPG